MMDWTPPPPLACSLTPIHAPTSYGKGGEVASNRLEEQELSVLSLHLLQICLVYVNTLMIQSVLGDRAGSDELAPEDLRALSPLIYNHVNPYGIFELDMEQRIRIAA